MYIRGLILAAVCVMSARAEAEPPLAAAGYAVLPTPQRVTLAGSEFRIGPKWHVEREAGVAESDVAPGTLIEELAARHGLRLAVDKSDGPAIRLAIRPGSVAIGVAQDRDREVLAAQAYRLELGENEVRITANAAPGLFYGVETLVQLVKHRDGGLWLPAGEITDWPDLQIRTMYWDDAHHLERFDALKRAIRQAAFFKLNGFALKLEGHFQFHSAPALVEPQALSPAELQELTDYGLKYQVQLIPYLDAPAHVAFILKHPEYAPLRAFADSNYEMCVTNPATYKLVEGMCQDLLDANRGVSWFYLSTDEPYYIGMADDAQCGEVARKRELGSTGKLLAEFLTKAAGYLHERGRTVVFWGEPPLKPADVPSLPKFLVNGETLDPKFDSAFKAHGIRQMLYTSTEGEERLFPDYFVRPTAERLRPPQDAKPRVPDALATINSPATRRDADLMGLTVAGWADMGLHPETFWCGYATIGAAGWNPAGTEAAGAMADFYRLFYGPSAQSMDRVYQLLAYQAQFWNDSWDSAQSKLRPGIWGNSEGIFRPRHPAHDQVLPLPPAPAAEKLAYDSHWSKDQARRLELARKSVAESDELINLLWRNQKQAEFNRYNLEVLLSVARICRHNAELLLDLGRMDELLAIAAREAAADHPAEAVAAVDGALKIAQEIRARRNEVFQSAVETWYKTWLPRVTEANGRTFLHEMDDVKDHLPDRTADMRYLIYRESNLSLGEWVGKIEAARNSYAKAHGLVEVSRSFDWDKTE